MTPEEQEDNAPSSAHMYMYGDTPPVVVKSNLIKLEVVVTPFCTGALSPSTAEVITVSGGV